MPRTITAIIAVYNGERYIEAAIKSILAQTVPITEIIIIDDGSNDATVQKIEAFQLPNIILLKQQNSGQAKAINAALPLVKGDFITFLDADDIWKSNKTALQLAAFEKNPTAQLCFGGMEEFISPELPIVEQQKIRVNPVNLYAKVRPCMMIRRKTMQEFVFFPEVPTMDFIAWYASIKHKVTSEVFVDAIVLERRLHLNNVSRLEQKKADIATTFKAILEQRRKANQSNG
jgi:glycosyltransferase involved in cell wall biosynthesis